MIEVPNQSKAARSEKVRELLSDIDPSDAALLPDVATSEFMVVVDTREQAPYHFTGIVDRKTKREIVVPLRHSGLRSGDYSIFGLEHEIAVERKSLKDFYRSISSDRDRFEREIVRLNEMRFALVVIEADWDGFMRPESFTKVTAETAVATIQSWSIKYPRVHWEKCPDRGFAEVYTYRQLEMYWRIRQHEIDEHQTRQFKQVNKSGMESIGNILSGLNLEGIGIGGGK